jgi:hypothetical protein
MSCNCDSSEKSIVSVIDFEDYIAQVKSLGFEITQARIANATVVGEKSKIFLFGGKICPAYGTANGEQGCVSIPMAGIPVKMCWKIDGTIDLPNSDLTIELSFSLGSIVYYQIKYKVLCNNLPDLKSCKFEFISETVNRDVNAVKGDFWACLRKCAPNCLDCLTDYYCWAACSAYCVWKCT